MKYEAIKMIPKEFIEVASFFFTVLFGAIYKIVKQKEDKGIKITFSKICTEVVMSFFVALVVYAFFDQFLNCNRFFTYVMSSLAGSMSNLFHKNIEDLFNYIFNAGKKKIDQVFKINNNEAS